MRKKVVFAVIILVIVLIAVFGVRLAYEGASKYLFEQSTDNASGDAYASTYELNITFVSSQTSWTVAMSNLISSFENAYPNYKINYEIYSESEFYEDTLNELYARGELGDLVEMSTVAYFEQEGVLSVIPEELANLTAVKSSFDGEVYGLGTVAYTTGVVYNKSLFEQYGLSEPTTYQEFLELCDTLSEKGVTPITIGGANKWATSAVLDHFFHTDVLQNNAQWLTQMEAGTVHWTDEDVETMFSDIQYFFKHTNMDALWASTPNTSVPSLIINQEVAMTYAASWMINDVETLSSEVELGWFYLPDDEGNIVLDKQTKSYWTITNACANDPEKLEVAEAFLNYFYDAEQYADMCTSISGMSVANYLVEPGYSTLQQEVVDEAHGAEKICRLTLSNALIPQDFRRELYSSLYEMLSGETDVQTMCESLESLWNVDGEVD